VSDNFTINKPETCLLVRYHFRLLLKLSSCVMFLSCTVLFLVLLASFLSVSVSVSGSQSQSHSYITTYGQLASLSSNKAPIRGLRIDLY
jgi:hypothetical protein